MSKWLSSGNKWVHSFFLFLPSPFPPPLLLPSRQLMGYCWVEEKGIIRLAGKLSQNMENKDHVQQPSRATIATSNKAAITFPDLILSWIWVPYFWHILIYKLVHLRYLDSKIVSYEVQFCSVKSHENFSKGHLVWYHNTLGKFNYFILNKVYNTRKSTNLLQCLYSIIVKYFNISVINQKLL